MRAAGELLRQLDQRLLPPLAHGLTRLGHGPVRLRVLTAAALLSSAAVLVTAVWAADRGPRGDLTVGDVTRVGVIEGDSIPGYVQSSRSELAAMVTTPPRGAEGETYALVTLSAYLAPDRLTPVFTGVNVSEVFGRVPLPETQTQIVHIPAMRLPDDVVANMSEVADRKEIEARNYQVQGARLTGDSDEERRLRAQYDDGARIALAEATAYRSRCSCVYAAVVRATPSALQKVAGRSEVRAVDPAPEVSRLDRAVFLPPLPEQEDVVRPPADKPGPAAGSPDDDTQPPGDLATDPPPSLTPSPGTTRTSPSAGPTGLPTRSSSPAASESAVPEPSASTPRSGLDDVDEPEPDTPGRPAEPEDLGDPAELAASPVLTES